MADFDAMYARSLRDPNGFWGEAAEAIHWDERWDRVLDDDEPPFYRWFTGGVLNTCYNALDRHVENGRADQAALIYDSAMTDTVASYTYREMRDWVARFAGVLRNEGIEPGDRVIIYMPMVPEAAVAMLACARIGAIHSVVFGGFAAKELAKRIDDAKPKLIVSASCGLEPKRTVAYTPLLDEAIEIAAAKPERCIILQRSQEMAALTEGRDVEWEAAMQNAEPVDCVPVQATDPLYILYTSGTTGTPKGVVRDHGGHAVALTWSMKHLYGVEPGDVYWAASDVGWVVGHSYIVYGPLLNGNTTVMYEGKPIGTPDAGAFWRVVSDHGVKVLFTAPTAIRAVKRVDPEGDLIQSYDLSSFEALFLAGERCDPDTLHWSQDHLGVPVIDHWWQTETGWPVCCNPFGIELMPIKAGSAGPPVPGYDVQVLTGSGEQAGPDQIGSILMKLPMPPGTLPELWQNRAGYRASYLEAYNSYYLTGDAGYKDEDGYVWVMGRTDDIINVAGHRLSTGAMEEVLAAHDDVAECAVVGKSDDLKGEVPFGLVVLKDGVHRPEEDIVEELIGMVREQIGPVASFKSAVVVPRLPKTRSGKVLRRTIKQIAEGETYSTPATIEDKSALTDIEEHLARKGIAE